jgi:3-oxoacyl-[acyl-carrier protein] reductase
MRFANKVVLVTGASEGLGKGIAAAFAREGANVALNGRHADKLAAAVDDVRRLTGTDSATVIGIAADIGDSAAVKSMFEQLVAAFGTIDVLINNAALTPSDAESTKARLDFMQLTTTPIEKHSLQVTSQMSDERWLRMINTNVNGTFYCTREALRLMEPKRYGKIVNIGSIAGITGLSAHSPHYSASKGAMVAFTKAVAVEVAGVGINVNCIAAGGIATEGWNEAVKQGGEGFKRQLMQLIPMGRMGTINEYAALAQFLAGEDSAYLTGQIISPNGGMYT